jgi:hypothetical protein
MAYNPLSQPFLFGINIDAILNGVGMLLAGGYFNSLSFASFSRSVFSTGKASASKVAPAKAKYEIEIDSRAYEEKSLPVTNSNSN